MTDMFYSTIRRPNNKKRITITLSEETFLLLENEVKYAQKLNPKWNRSKLIDAIVYFELQSAIR